MRRSCSRPPNSSETARSPTRSSSGRSARGWSTRPIACRVGGTTSDRTTATSAASSANTRRTSGRPLSCASRRRQSRPSSRTSGVISKKGSTSRLRTSTAVPGATTWRSTSHRRRPRRSSDRSWTCSRHFCPATWRAGPSSIAPPGGGARRSPSTCRRRASRPITSTPVSPRNPSRWCSRTSSVGA